MSSSLLGQIDADSAEALLGPLGPVAMNLPQFESRKEQQQMLRAVFEAYEERKVALIEAGTGTGKSLAYLVPAMLWASLHGEKTVVSTNTINLQEQLLDKDIPFLKKSLGLDLKAVLVKGMGNYVCLRKLSEALDEASLLEPEEEEAINQIGQWAQDTKEGSRSSLPMHPKSDIWDKVRVEGDQCSHKRCPHYDECFYFKARKKAQNAQLLIVNHSLLFSDIAMRSESETSILPDYDRLVLDEAHHLEDVATEHMAKRVSERRLTQVLAQLTSSTGNHSNGKLPQLRAKLLDYFGMDRDLEVDKLLRRLDIDLPGAKRTVQKLGVEFFHTFMDLVGGEPKGEKKLRLLAHHRKYPTWVEEIEPALEALLEPGKGLVAALKSLCADIVAMKQPQLLEKTASLRLDVGAIALRLEGMLDELHEFIRGEEDKSFVRWIEVASRRSGIHIQVVRARLDVDQLLAEELFARFGTITLCSATLATNKKFDFVRSRLGLTGDKLPEKQISELILDSPFDYERQALLCVPTDMPAPSGSSFTNQAIEQIHSVVEASRGGVFVLFTSYSMLNLCYRALAPRLRHPLMKQGDMSRSQLLQQFRKKEGSVLFGTDSFWEGVDVVGDALRCVILVKLPFQVPSEPIVEARTELMQSEGKDPFMEYSVPKAIVKFKQGFGRLIRNKEDSGCIVCLDPRLIKARGYGRLFLNSLPACRHYYGEQASIARTMRDFYRDRHK